MQKKIFFVLSVILALGISSALAQPDVRWRKKADMDGDGKIDKRELANWNKLKKERIDANKDGIIDGKERRLYWRYASSRVNTALEKKYDSNSNGWLEPNEAKKLLEDRYAQIKKQGKARVDTELEADYDANDDGIIDAQEAKDLKEDLGI